MTQRQEQVLLGICQDRCLKEIAAGLGISRKSVEFHWAKLKRALHVQSQVGAVLWAVRNGVVTFSQESGMSISGAGKPAK